MSDSSTSIELLFKKIENYLKAFPDKYAKFTQLINNFSKDPNDPNQIFHELISIVSENKELLSEISKQIGYFSSGSEIIDNVGNFLQLIRSNIKPNMSIFSEIYKITALFLQGFIPFTIFQYHILHHISNSKIKGKNAIEKQIMLLNMSLDDIRFQLASYTNNISPSILEQFHEKSIDLNYNPPNPLQILVSISLENNAEIRTSMLKCLYLFGNGIISIKTASNWLSSYTQPLGEFFIHTLAPFIHIPQHIDEQNSFQSSFKEKGRRSQPSDKNSSKDSNNSGDDDNEFNFDDLYSRFSPQQIFINAKENLSPQQNEWIFGYEFYNQLQDFVSKNPRSTTPIIISNVQNYGNIKPNRSMPLIERLTSEAIAIDRGVNIQQASESIIEMQSSRIYNTLKKLRDNLVNPELQFRIQDQTVSHAIFGQSFNPSPESIIAYEKGLMAAGKLTHTKYRAVLLYHLSQVDKCSTEGRCLMNSLLRRSFVIREMLFIGKFFKIAAPGPRTFNAKVDKKRSHIEIAIETCQGFCDHFKDCESLNSAFAGFKEAILGKNSLRSASFEVGEEGALVFYHFFELLRIIVASNRVKGPEQILELVFQKIPPYIEFKDDDLANVDIVLQHFGAALKKIGNEPAFHSGFIPLTGHFIFSISIMDDEVKITGQINPLIDI